MKGLRKGDKVNGREGTPGGGEGGGGTYDPVMMFGLLSYMGPSRPPRLTTSSAVLEIALLALSEEGMVRARPSDCSVARKMRMKVEVFIVGKRECFFIFFLFLYGDLVRGREESRQCGTVGDWGVKK